MKHIALIVAAGSGLRAGAGGALPPKQYRHIAGRPVLSTAISAFATHPEIDSVAVVINPDHQALYEEAVAGLEACLLPAIAGGPNRMDSVRLGLEALAKHEPEIVLIHDAARPFVSAEVISRAIAAARAHGGALPVLPVTDTIKKVDDEGTILETLDRDTLRAAQTPQTFRFGPILDAHRAAAAAHLTFTDDAGIAEWAGLPVHAVAGDANNRKLTLPEDFDAPAAPPPPHETRVGSGFDVHAFGPGDAVILGGVALPHDRALKGHSDADVVLHALTDAIFGTLADGDIGSHFPPSDPQWKGANSRIFLEHAVDRLDARGGALRHVDLTIMCERPKIGPHRDAIRVSIAEILGLAIGRVSVKATTTERLGFLGRGEGIAAMATVTVRFPAED